jgi:hypothetical protein
MKTLLIVILVLFVACSLAGIIKSFIPVIKLTFAGFNLPKIRLTKKQLGTIILITYLSISVLYCIIVSFI